MKITIFCANARHERETITIAEFHSDPSEVIDGIRLFPDDQWWIPARFVSYGKAKGRAAMEIQRIDEDGRFHPPSSVPTFKGPVLLFPSDDGRELRKRLRFVCSCGDNVPVMGVSDWPDILDRLAQQEISEISLSDVRSLAGYTGRSAEKKGGRHYQGS